MKNFLLLQKIWKSEADRYIIEKKYLAVYQSKFITTFTRMKIRDQVTPKCE